MSKEKGIELLINNVSDPKKIENSDLFSIFGEIEMNLDGILELLMFIFAYMPSHVEVITPENLKVRNENLNMFANELTRRLHQYDELAKTIIMERDILRRQLIEKGEKPVNVFENIPIKEKKPKKSRKKK